MVKLIKGIFDVIETAVGGVVEGGTDIVKSAGSSEREDFNASFMPAGELLSFFNKGFSLAGGLRATSCDVAFKNALIVGPSGSGKTSSVLVGSVFTLARGNASMCLMDVSGEIFSLTSGYLEKKGYKIHVINFEDGSDSFNPLDLCKTVTDILKVSFLIIQNSKIEAKNDPYWANSGEMMLVVFIEYLVFHAAPEYRNMANLIWLTDSFAGDAKKVHTLFVKIQKENPELYSKYKALNAVSEKTLQSTLSTVRTALRVFSTPALKRCTATSTIDLSSFRKTKSVLYICTPLNDVSYYASFSALLYSALFKEMMGKIPNKSDLSVFCLMDELVQMKFQDISAIFANCRKYRLGCMGIVQDEKMLEISMSLAESHGVKTNSYSKVYLPGQPLQTCRNLEEILGKCSVENNGTVRTRPLMTAAEIRMLPKNKAIILAGSEPPILATVRPHYDHWLLKYRTRIQPYQPQNNKQTEPPLIPVNET